MKPLDKLELKTGNFASGNSDYVPDDGELRIRDVLIEAAGNGDKAAKLTLMSPPYSITCLVIAGKKIV